MEKPSVCCRVSKKQPARRLRFIQILSDGSGPDYVDERYLAADENARETTVGVLDSYHILGLRVHSRLSARNNISAVSCVG